MSVNQEDIYAWQALLVNQYFISVGKIYFSRRNKLANHEKTFSKDELFIYFLYLSLIFSEWKGHHFKLGYLSIRGSVWWSEVKVQVELNCEKPHRAKVAC